jgi:diguanylate cyclase (GGDEF)-like protein
MDLHESPLLPILDSSFEGIALAEPDTGAIIYVNPTLQRWLRTSPSRLPSTINDLLATEDTGPILDQFDSARHQYQPEITLSAPLLSAGARQQFKLRVCRLSLPDGPLLGLILSNVDEPTRCLPMPEHRDPLTGLPDRAFLLSRLNARMGAEHSRDRRFAVLFIDLDNFKQVNDTHGHLIGDRVLSLAAKRLSDSVRDGDHVVRFGGDEFVVLIEGVAAQSDIEPLVSRIHSVFAEAISLPEGDFTLKVSVGAALASPELQTPDELLAAADRAMYAAKRANS